MPENQFTSFITTASGFCGGMTRALMGRVVLSTVTISSLIEVALYAGTSALVGYGVGDRAQGRRGAHYHTNVYETRSVNGNAGVPGRRVCARVRERGSR